MKIVLEKRIHYMRAILSFIFRQLDEVKFILAVMKFSSLSHKMFKIHITFNSNRKNDFIHTI